MSMIGLNTFFWPMVICIETIVAAAMIVKFIEDVVETAMEESIIEAVGLVFVTSLALFVVEAYIYYSFG